MTKATAGYVFSKKIIAIGSSVIGSINRVLGYEDLLVNIPQRSTCGKCIHMRSKRQEWRHVIVKRNKTKIRHSLIVATEFYNSNLLNKLLKSFLILIGRLNFTL